MRRTYRTLAVVCLSATAVMAAPAASPVDRLHELSDLSVDALAKIDRAKLPTEEQAGFDIFDTQLRERIWPSMPADPVLDRQIDRFIAEQRRNR